MAAPRTEPDDAMQHGNGSGRALSARLRALEHAMRTPVGTLAALLEVINAAPDRQGMEGTVQTMARQIRLLTSQLEQLHDIGTDMAVAEKGSP